MRTQALVLLIVAFTSANAIQRRSQFTRYRSWNSRMYPVWKDGDPRFRNCWLGGEVTFDIKSDAPTLTGARTTFTINLNFPPNQTALSDGQVVWAQNCTIDGQQYQQGQSVYPNQDAAQMGLFPDGTPFTRSQNKKPHYVFVWKTRGQYWQVADGPSSSLTIGTDNVPLGSYNMEVVIYHCRGKDKFIPLGYASTVFTVTDQVPFTVSLAQVSDINQGDQNFIQNQAIAFSVKLHDPSQYLSTADISFSWDFGDNTGTLISRDQTVTHTYLSVGSFKPQVILMASIPNGCTNPTAVAPIDASAVPAVVVMASTPAPAAPADGEDAIALDVPTSDSTPVAASAQPANTDANTDDEDTDTEAAEVAPVVDAANTVAPAAAVDVAAEAADADTAAADETTVVTDADAENVPVIDAAASVAPAAEGEEAIVEVADGVATDVAAADATDAAAAADATDAAAAADATDAAAAADATDAAAAADATDAAADATDAAAAADATDAAADATDAAAAADATDAAADATDAAADATDAAAAADATDAAADATDADAAAAVDVAIDAAAEVAEAATEAPAENVVAPVASEATAIDEAAPADVAAETEAEVLETENEVAATPAAAEPQAAEGEVQAEMETDAAQVALVVAKRQAPELTADCTVYRYGSLATSVDIVQGIESVEIVQVANVVSMATELDQNAVDVTITCQGSLPSEVCTVISDADCITPVETICNAASPSPDCQLILRQFFNNSGVFCLNVSLTNDVSLAVASARVSVSVGSGGSPAGTAATVLGVMVLACVVCCIGLMYRRFKQYQPLRDDHVIENGRSSMVTSVPLLLWNLLSRQSPGESRPLLQGKLV